MSTAAGPLNPNAKPFGAKPCGSANNRKSRRGGKVVEVVVSTPWFSNGVRKSEICLEGEVVAYGGFMRLGEKELDGRLAVVGDVRKVVGAAGRVTAYGSVASGTVTEGSCVDMWVVIDEITEDTIRGIVEGARTKPTSDIVCTELGGFVQVTAPNSQYPSVKYNITFSSDDSTPLLSNVVNQSWSDTYPHAVTVLHILREVLDQTGNLDVCNGGLSSYALYAMIIAVCNISDQPTAHGLLLEVCRWYGTVFDFNALGVSTSTGWCAKPVGTTEALFVEDPLDKSNNIASGCSRLFAIKVQFQHCFKTLQRWVETPGQPATTTYKGRTPLSGIISHKRLWPRAERLTSPDQDDASSEHTTDESSEVLSQPANSRPAARSLAQIFAVTSYDSLCSLDDPAELEEEDELLCDVGRTTLAF